jgi:N6-L-threonylcarbamoyladenine synthase
MSAVYVGSGPGVPPSLDGTGMLLALETSCDETSAAVFDLAERTLLSNVVSSQIDLHAAYGGVVPELASRAHLEALPLVVDEALAKAGVSMSSVKCVAVTKGPGLVGALLVGVSYAKSLASALGCPLVGVNHLAGHLSACFLAGARPPFVCLLASGGHTMVVYVTGYREFEVMGSTVDDAAGEAFDKVARTLGLPYPGGPALEALALGGDSERIRFTRPMIGRADYDFSFSGIKSAVLNIVNREALKGETFSKADIAASFQACVVDILADKTFRAALERSVSSVAVCGGVCANGLLRREFLRRSEEASLELFVPDREMCSDNAGMIAIAAYHNALAGEFADAYLNATPSLSL